MAALKASQPEPICQMADLGEGAKAIKYLSLFIAFSLVEFIFKYFDLKRRQLCGAFAVS